MKKSTTLIWMTDVEAEMCCCVTLHAFASSQAVHAGHVPSVQGSTRSDSQSVAHAGQVRVKVLVNAPVETSHSHAPPTNSGTTQTRIPIVKLKIPGKIFLKSR